MKIYLLALLLLIGCRTQPAPIIETCILGQGGLGDCVEHDGSKLQRPPSQMVNYFCTNQTDEAAFANFCYATDAEIKQELKKK